MEGSCQLHDRAILLPWRNNRYPLNIRLVGQQSRPGCFGKEKSCTFVSVIEWEAWASIRWLLLMFSGCLEAERLDSKVCSTSSTELCKWLRSPSTETSALPNNLSLLELSKCLQDSFVGVTIWYIAVVLCNQRKHSKYTVCTTVSSLFPDYCGMFRLPWPFAGCPPCFAFHLAFMYFRVTVLEPFVRNTRETHFILCNICVSRWI